MSIQCGECKNVMPSASLMNHKERKHSLLDHVPYVKVTHDHVKKFDLYDHTTSPASISAADPLVKCRFCPNRLPEGAMERHLQRCHIDCHLCGKILLKSKCVNHMKQKHGQDASIAAPAKAAGTVIAKSATMSNSGSSSNNGVLREMAVLSQSKLSVESTPSPSPTIKPLNLLHKQTTLSSSSSSVLPLTLEPKIIHVDIWQLSRYMRQGRVYKSNDWLYLRNSAFNSM